MSVLVETKNIRKRFPSGEKETEVLHGIDMQARRGELALLVGPSGCGKTTLISIISGILSPNEGTVTIDGTDLTALSRRQKVLFRREHIGFIFQQFNLLPALSAAENASIALVAGGVPLKEAVEKAREVFAFLGMEDQAEKLPSQLSGGQQQRVAIARALVHEPKLIVCDEPTSSLDAESGQAVMKLLKKVAQDNHRGVLVVTHDPRIFDFADRMFSMEDGRITREDVNGDNQRPPEERHPNDT